MNGPCVMNEPRRMAAGVNGTVVDMEKSNG